MSQLEFYVVYKKQVHVCIVKTIGVSQVNIDLGKPKSVASVIYLDVVNNKRLKVAYTHAQEVTSCMK